MLSESEASRVNSWLSVARIGLAGVAAGLFVACADDNGSQPAAPTPSPSAAAAELRNVNAPEFETREDLEAYIEERHMKLGTFAEERGDVELSAAASFSRFLPAAQVDGLVEKYNLAVRLKSAVDGWVGTGN